MKYPQPKKALVFVTNIAVIDAHDRYLFNYLVSNIMRVYIHINHDFRFVNSNGYSDSGASVA